MRSKQTPVGGSYRLCFSLNSRIFAIAIAIVLLVGCNPSSSSTDHAATSAAVKDTPRSNSTISNSPASKPTPIDSQAIAPRSSTPTEANSTAVKSSEIDSAASNSTKVANQSAAPPAKPTPRNLEQRVGSHFIDLQNTVPHLGKVERLEIPDFPGAHAIWGGTGRDDRGHIWIGGCAEGPPIPSAYVFEYDPFNAKMTLRGDIVSRLRQAGKYRDGEGQMKVHSKFVQADDGWLYFASMDEQGEHDDGSKLPIWGSHLWRLKPEEDRWEHLLATPEALIAVSGGGRWIYALGYFQHVLYQYDTATGKSNSIVVGSLDGHITRNFLSDLRGHVYVPRLTRTAAEDSDDKPPVVHVSLVEFGPDLKEINATPLINYLGTTPTESHGIVGIAYLADGQMMFTTHAGELYHIEPRDGQPAAVGPLGWFHPQGSAYSASMFTLDGRRYLAGIVQHNGAFEWVTYDLQTYHSKAEPFPLVNFGLVPGETLLYGSLACDDAGACYIVGISNYRPCAFKVQIDTSSAADASTASSGEEEITH